MKSLKEQLQSIRNKLRVSSEERRKNSPKHDFSPPPSWLADVQPTPKKSSARKPVPKPAATAVAPVTKSPPRPNISIPPPFTPHIDGHVLNMPAWSNVGSSLQHPKYRNGRAMTARIGIDFGTAFTKVAIRAGADLIPIEWSAVTGDNSETGRYVVPCFVVRAPDGEFCWRRCTGGDIPKGNLKLPIINEAGSGECPIATVAYLALVIRYARAFLYQKSEIGSKLADRSLRWELNIGCPTKPHEKPKTVDQFRRIAQTAWRLAAKERILEQDVLTAWSSENPETDLEAEPYVVPEFVAQIAGYLKSPQVKDGLHTLIDIGAATLDVATFNVVLQNDSENPPRIPIFFSDVDNLGTHYLRHNRHSKLDLDLSWNDATPVESSDEFCQQYDKPLDEVHKIDNDFMKCVISSIHFVIHSTRTNTRGDPQSPAWQEGLPIFITGGGSNCELYRQAIKKVEEKIKSEINSMNFRFIKLDTTNANMHHTNTGNRLTVAFGLTVDSDNIACIVPHRDIENITRPIRTHVDHTDLYVD